MGREMIRLHLDVHDHILNLRSVENTIKKGFFERLWDASNEKQRKEVREIVMRGDKEALTAWMDEHTDVELGELSYNKLKKLGRRLRVTNYCRLERHRLEDAIKEKRNANP